MCVHVCVCVHVTRSFVRSGKEEKSGSPVCRMVLQTSRVIVRACVCVWWGYDHQTAKRWPLSKCVCGCVGWDRVTLHGWLSVHVPFTILYMSACVCVFVCVYIYLASVWAGVQPWNIMSYDDKKLAYRYRVQSAKFRQQFKKGKFILFLDSCFAFLQSDWVWIVSLFWAAPVDSQTGGDNTLRRK